MYPESPSRSALQLRFVPLRAEGAFMNYTNAQGKTTVAPDVLVTITRLSALSVPGVSRMANVTGGVNKLFKRGVHEGVRLEVKDNTVFANLYLILKHDVNIRGM